MARSSIVAKIDFFVQATPLERDHGRPWQKVIGKITLLDGFYSRLDVFLISVMGSGLDNENWMVPLDVRYVFNSVARRQTSSFSFS